MAEYIEREALTALAYKSGDYGHPAVVDLEDIADIPAADVAPVVHGRWVDYQEEQWMVGLVTIGYQCSICGYNTGCDTNYCPNCGAKMDGDG